MNRPAEARDYWVLGEHVNELVRRLEAQRDASEAALARVKALHYETEGVHAHTVCAHVNCLDWSLDQHRWPCPTIRAIAGPEAPEIDAS